MVQKSTKQIWLDTGYELFASYGFAGIATERLAKILNLNKSGFYHYFGNQEIYLEELLNHHQRIANTMAKEIDFTSQVDPEYIKLLISYKLPIIFHNQLARHRENKVLYHAFTKVNFILDTKAAPLFARFFELDDRQDLAVRYYQQVRDMFYSQITMERMNVEFITHFFYDAKDVIQKAGEYAAMRKEQLAAARY